MLFDRLGDKKEIVFVIDRSESFGIRNKSDKTLGINNNNHWHSLCDQHRTRQMKFISEIVDESKSNQSR